MGTVREYHGGSSGEGNTSILKSMVSKETNLQKGVFHIHFLGQIIFIS